MSAAATISPARAEFRFRMALANEASTSSNSALCFPSSARRFNRGKTASPGNCSSALAPPPTGLPPPPLPSPPASGGLWGGTRQFPGLRLCFQRVFQNLQSPVQLLPLHQIRRVRERLVNLPLAPKPAATVLDRDQQFGDCGDTRITNLAGIQHPQRFLKSVLAL